MEAHHAPRKASETSASDELTIAGCRIQPALNRILGEDGPVQVEPKVMGVLLALAAAPGQVISRRELIDKVWEREAVSDDVLTRSVVELRKIFSDSSTSPRVIDTIRKRGYRLIAPVEDAPPTTAENAPSSRAVVEQAPPPASGRRAAWLMASIFLVAAVAVLGFLRFAPRPPPPPGDTRLHIAPLTASPVQDRDPAVSPDGSRIVFMLRSPQGDNADLFVKLSNGGDAVRLTDDPLDDRYPAFSPDGTEIAFVRLRPSHIQGDDEPCAIYLIATTGGPERRLAPCDPSVDQRLAFSPDGAWLALSHPIDGGRDGLHLLSTESLELVPLTAPEPPFRYDSEPAFSPDGQWIAFVRSIGPVSDVHVVPAAGGEVRRLTFDHRDVAGVTFADDGESVVFSSDRAGPYGLWRVDADGGEPVWLTGGGAKIKHPAHARDARVVAYEYWQYEINVYRLPIDGEGDGERIVTSSDWDFDPRPSPAGGRLAFVSNRSGSHEIWTAGADGNGPAPLTRFGDAMTSQPRWSPDGSALVFVSFAGGQADLYRIEDGGAVPERLTHDEDVELEPSWSRDGRSIYYGAAKSGTWTIWRLTADGGEAVAVTTGAVAQESWDGESLYFTRRETPGLWQISFASDEARRVLDDFPASRITPWTVGPQGVYYLARSASRDLVLRLLPAGGGAVRTLRSLPELSRAGFGVSADGRALYVARTDRAACDIMVARNLP